MADQIDIVVRLRDAVQASRDAKLVERGIKGIGDGATTAARKAAALGPAVDRSVSLAERGFGRLARSMRFPAVALGGLGTAGALWGLQFNAQVESARLRFKLFTDDVDGLTKGIQKIDMSSAFNFADLSDIAAQLGNAGIDAADLPNVLQATANAAAASGKGLPALQSIGIALSQIASKGRLSQEEINQLNEAGAPGAQKTIQKAFHLTKDEIGNLGAQGLSSRKAIRALTEEWTSGRMAKAASDQTKTLGGQWDLLTGNAQKASGALTESLAKGLEGDVLPAANRALTGITKIFNDDTLSPHDKLQRARQVIDKELGPVADDLKKLIDDADIPQHLGTVIGKAVPLMVGVAAEAAPKVAEAFVNAWLHAGIPAQLATVLYLGAKGGKLARNLGLGSLGGKGGLAGLFGAGKPVPVIVMNKGWGTPGGPGTPGPGKVSRGVGAVRKGARVAAAFSPYVAAPVAGYEFWKYGEDHARFHGVDDIARQTIDSATPDHNSLVGQVLHQTNVAMNPQSLIGLVEHAAASAPVRVSTQHTSIIKIGERVAAQAVDRYKDQQKARKG